MVIPILTALLSIVWALGLMAMVRLPLNLLTSIVPSLLLAIGFTEDVHMISGYHERLEQKVPKLAAIRGMLEETALPLAITTATTVVGFGSLILTDVTMLIQFGQASSMAILANSVVTMLLLPLLLRLWPVPRRFRRSALADVSPRGLLPLLTKLGHFDLRYRVHILVVAGLVTAVSMLGWTRLRVDTDFVSLFPKDSVIRHRIEDLHRSLGGAMNFFVVVDTGRDDGVKDPQVLRKIAALQDFLHGTGKVAKTVSVADYVRKMHREVNGGDPAFEVIPDGADEVAQYLLLLEGRELDPFVDFNASGANIVVRHNLTGSWAISNLRREIEAHIAREFPPTLIARPTGEAILTNNAVDFLAVNELQSLSLTFVAIALIHAVAVHVAQGGLPLDDPEPDPGAHRVRADGIPRDPAQHLDGARGDHRDRHRGGRYRPPHGDLQPPVDGAPRPAGRDVQHAAGAGPSDHLRVPGADRGLPSALGLPACSPRSTSASWRRS